jgi:uncharacterized protein (DUF1330 family)
LPAVIVGQPVKT